MDIPLMMMKKRKICDTYTPGNVVSPVASSENYESDGSSMSCCSRNGSSNSKSLDLDANGGEVADKEKKSIEEESESEKMPPLEEFGEVELNEMPPLEEFGEVELNEIIPTTEEIEEFFTRCELRTCKRLREKRLREKYIILSLSFGTTSTLRKRNHWKVVSSGSKYEK
ncbi:uncharacterized protein LOC125810278 [Solanum verrucosum]|uniref:uncharacterized protein LOC125810278 n=1 Tax=Solanum verrucosum TaxID=315347 RepID=UPI0020D017AE|nr:uncharacterized protein LOC125810278 [Solanum verrucosum]